MWEWIGTWTFFNWIALIAFLAFPFTVLNLYFNLKPRYLDWRATKTKKGYEKRLKELTSQLNFAQTYRLSITYLFADIMIEAGNAMFALVVALIQFVLITFGFYLPSFKIEGGRVKESLFLIITLVFLFICLYYITRIVRLARNTRNPEFIVERMIHLIEDARRKGFGVTGDDTMIESIRQREMFTEFERNYITQIVDNSKKLNK
jgi:uncharacterized membrane protein